MDVPPEQEIEVSVQPDVTVSVRVLVPSWVPSRLYRWCPVLPEVVMEVLPTPEPDPVKPNVSLPPTVVLIRSREAFWVLVNVQESALPAPTVIWASVSPWTKVPWKFVPSEL